MSYSVYVHTNKINGKKYVGITSANVHERWQNGKHYKRHSRFYADILMHGWNNFEHDVLFSDLSKDEAELKEKELIEIWDLTDSSKGYNVYKGGLSFEKHSPKTRERLSIKNSGENNPFYAKKHSEETKLLMAQNRPKRAVLCVETGITYVSTREAQRLTGADHGDISKCCNGKKKTCGGFHWRFSDERS